METQTTERLEIEILPPSKTGGREIGKLGGQPPGVEKFRQRNIARELALKERNALTCLYRDMCYWDSRRDLFSEQVEEFEREELPKIELAVYTGKDKDQIRRDEELRSLKMRKYARLTRLLQSASRNMRESAAELGSFTFGKMAQIDHNITQHAKVTFVITPDMDKL